jgi:glycogen debranching enzyme
MRLRVGLIAFAVLFCSGVWSMDANRDFKSYEQQRSLLKRQLRKNLKGPDWLTPYRRAEPAPKYPGVYLWDSAFIAEVWRRIDPSVAKDIVLSVLHGQRKDGRIPHVRSILGPSQWTQPPLLSWITWRVYQSSGDRDFLTQTYPRLLRYNQWLQAHRKNIEGLYFWVHPYESGIDNSPRFSDRAEKNFANTSQQAAVDFSSYMVLDFEHLEKIARALGHQTAAKRFELQRQRLAHRIENRLFDKKRNLYFDWDYEKGQFVEVDSISSLMPLWAGVSSPARAKILRDHIMDPRFYNTPIPLPSVARTDPSFEKDCWRGPVWINTAYAVLLGLNRYGFKSETKDLGRRLVRGVYETAKTEGSFYEYYDPDQPGLRELSRKKGNWWKQITLGSKPVRDFVGWTGLVLNIESMP